MEECMNEPTNAPMLPPPSGVSEWFSVWRDAVTKPNEQTFATIVASPNAKYTTAFLWVFISSLIEFFVIFLVQSGVIRQALQDQGLGNNLPGGGVGIILLAVLCGAPVLAILGVVFFAIGTAIVQWIAKLFGGRGTFDQMSYALAAIATPYALVSAVFVLLGAIPFVGLCFRIVLGLAGLYILVLQIMAVKGVNQFGWGQAVGSLLLPGLVLACCLVVPSAIAAMRLLGPQIGNTFSTLNNSLP